MSLSSSSRRWLSAGELNGFLALVIDNLSVLAFLSAALVGIFGFPAEFLVTHMLPGTALGVLVGDGIYTWMARRQRRSDATAMPLGVDAPTTIGMALLVLGPAFVAFKQQGMEIHGRRPQKSVCFEDVITIRAIVTSGHETLAKRPLDFDAASKRTVPSSTSIERSFDVPDR